jgi:DNA-binding transcriptional MocR family regulator
MPAEPYYPTRHGPAALRLSFGDLDEDAMRTGVDRLATALDRLRAAPAAAAR